MSIATRLGDWSGRGHVGEQAETGGACSSEHCSCWSHIFICTMQSCAILPAQCPSLGPARPSKRPSQVVTWLLCANAAGRCHERLGGTSGNPWATATAIAALCIARAYAYTVMTFTMVRAAQASPDSGFV